MQSDKIDPYYSQALDEIYRLRAAAAYEAAVIANTLLAYASLPVGVRRYLEGQYLRLTAAARGDTGTAYADVSSARKKEVLRAAGAPQCLTRGQWEVWPQPGARVRRRDRMPGTSLAYRVLERRGDTAVIQAVDNGEDDEPFAYEVVDLEPVEGGRR